MNKATIEAVLAFRDERNWRQFHNPKDLAISLSLEASELLENFQWKSAEEAVEQHLDDISEELADVLMYGILLADRLNLDLDTIIEHKLDKNKQKYPVNLAYGKKEKYTELK